MNERDPLGPHLHPSPAEVTRNNTNEWGNFQLRIQNVFHKGFVEYLSESRFEVSKWASLEEICQTW